MGPLHGPLVSEATAFTGRFWHHYRYGFSEKNDVPIEVLYIVMFFWLFSAKSGEGDLRE